jgi:hypothetical protein
LALVKDILKQQIDGLKDNLAETDKYHDAYQFKLTERVALKNNDFAAVADAIAAISGEPVLSEEGFRSLLPPPRLSAASSSFYRIVSTKLFEVMEKDTAETAGRTAITFFTSPPAYTAVSEAYDVVAVYDLGGGVVLKDAGQDGTVDGFEILPGVYEAALAQVVYDWVTTTRWGDFINRIDGVLARVVRDRHRPNINDFRVLMNRLGEGQTNMKMALDEWATNTDAYLLKMAEYEVALREISREDMERGIVAVVGGHRSPLRGGDFDTGGVSFGLEGGIWSLFGYGQAAIGISPPVSNPMVHDDLVGATKNKMTTSSSRVFELGNTLSDIIVELETL